jgi:hypothetical protein
MKHRRPLSFAFLVFAVAVASAQEPASRPAAPRLAAGGYVFEWRPEWLKLPEGMRLGNTHGHVAFTADDKVVFSTDSAHAVCVVEPDGRFVRSFAAEFAGGLHGLQLVARGGEDLLWVAHTQLHQAALLKLDGTVLKRVYFPKESGKYDSEERFLPTGVATLPDGRMFVTDGYGLGFVHRYAADGSYLGTFGGGGSEDGKFRTPHGIATDLRGKEPRVVVADRENHRVQIFDVEGKHLRTVTEGLRRPCNCDFHGELTAVADLNGCVALFDRDWKFLGRIGDQTDQKKWAGNGVPVAEWKDGEFIAPHACRFDAAGNLYVTEWLAAGRVVKLTRVASPAAK